ncbi:hypothetical protein HYN48_00795 [Flavobacterium magnum]|uniref:Uncharacterized protein n=1 Tax=Flavobacterium magnum TaxID=2162713 RepID=A0A2S0RCA2_9FLAO|nr:hypothetical protein HYN48_00795 [Flavobacterium magnum]
MPACEAEGRAVCEVWLTVKFPMLSQFLQLRVTIIARIANGKLFEKDAAFCGFQKATNGSSFENLQKRADLKKLAVKSRTSF